MPITNCCGPKLSACCLVISVWGIIQLAIMGAAFYMRSPNLIEDIGINEEHWETLNKTDTKDAIWDYVNQKYEQTAMNCWVAAAFYVITLIFSSVTCYLNSKVVY